jgi:tRNA-binding protein
LEVTNFLKAHKLAYQLKVDFGKLEIKHTRAQITTLYSKDELIGKKI